MRLAARAKVRAKPSQPSIMDPLADGRAPGMWNIAPRGLWYRPAPSSGLSAQLSNSRRPGLVMLMDDSALSADRGRTPRRGDPMHTYPRHAFETCRHVGSSWPTGQAALAVA